MARGEYYVDPASGNDTTGDGSSGTPWKTTQKALDTITPATDGDRINVKAGSADVLTAPLDFSTYSPSQFKQVTIQGYTSTAGDGGKGDIDGNGSSVQDLDTVEGFNFVDMKLHNSGTSVIVALDRYNVIANCEIYDGGTGVQSLGSGSPTSVIGCHLHDIDIRGTNAIQVVSYNYFENDGTRDMNIMMSGNIRDQITCIRNIFTRKGQTGGTAVSIADLGALIANNIFLDSGGTGSGISINATTPYRDSLMIVNNYFEGFSGAGGKGIDLSNSSTDTSPLAWIGNNAFYDNETDFDSEYDSGGPASVWDLSANDLALSVSGLQKSGSDTFANRLSYFAPTSDLRAKGFPLVT